MSDLLFDLDKGEAEVILLAKEMSADLVIMDEELGRKYAKLAGLTMTGTLGLLLKAKEQKLIENIKPLLFELRQKGVWISPQIINKTTSITNE